MEVIEAIETRRSIRHYRPQPVEEGMLSEVLEAAHRAPSWKNSQCWRFIVVADSGVKSRLADTLTRLSPSNAASDAIRQAPLAIVACAELRQSGYSSREPDSPATDKGDWYMYDVALAMQNLVLAAHSRGLGTVHVGLFDAGEAAALLGVPPGFCVVSMTPLGYPAERPEARPRKGLSEIVFYERFGSAK